MTVAAAPDLSPPLAGFWQPCMVDGECEGGLCYRPDTSMPGHCSKNCKNDCPDGYACKTVRTSQTTEIDECIPAADTMCKRCSTHRDCGDDSDLCLDIGGERFCTIDCKGNPGICPPGFECRRLGDIAEFKDVEQCMPTNNICCIDRDKDGRGKGDACVTTDCNDNNDKIYDDAVDICDGLDNDCKNGVDDKPTNCKKAECKLLVFGYSERAAEPCTAGACVMQPAKDCGLYTCSDGGENGDHCATACDGEDDRKCIPTAHCDANVCYSDFPDGQACNEDSDCQSNHCQNGFCCGAGDCCAQAMDCPNFGSFLPVCDDAATCQGTKGAAACNNFRCTTQNGVPDDSACTATVEANKCGFYKSIYCTGAVSQTQPTCPTRCNSNADCDADGFCEPTSKTCVEDLDNGRACGGDNERCKSGHCQNGFCCANGDCCAVESDCPASYTSPAVCGLPSVCQGTQNIARCLNNECSTENNVPNDAACGPAVLANDCGPYLPIYCNGQPTQMIPMCPTSCTTNGECDANAYCNASNVCTPDEANGKACRADDECQSNHCQNGFCCQTGDCCATSLNCGAYAQPAVCNSQSTCQGTRVDGICSAQFQCSSSVVQDDSACAGLPSNDCGPYPGITCTAAQNQPSNQQGLCSTTCMNDSGCDISAHCASGVCVPDQGQGGYCNVPNDCAAGLFCVDNVCCNSACNGTCEACDIPGSVGTCSPVPAGQDIDNECPGVSCAAYYSGWIGSSCYKKADVTDAQAMCNGNRACRTVAQECTLQANRQTSAALTCDATCQSPTANTCTGTTAGTCTNLNLGSESCGSGVCRVSSAICVNGRRNTCTPNWGAASTETCNSLDDNCDGYVDNGAFADGYESNPDCNSYKTLPAVGSDQTQTVNTLTLYPSGDVDYFRINANETDSSCACCDFFCTDEDYEMKVTLSVPAGAGSYSFCIARDVCGNVGNNCQTVSAGTSAYWSYQLDGGCPGNDNYTFYVRISGAGAPAYQCAPYTLSYFFDAGRCF